MAQMLSQLVIPVSPPSTGGGGEILGWGFLPRSCKFFSSPVDCAAPQDLEAKPQARIVSAAGLVDSSLKLLPLLFTGLRPFWTRRLSAYRKCPTHDKKKGLFSSQQLLLSTLHGQRG